MELLNRYKNLNQRLAGIRDILRDRVQLQVRAVDEVAILTDQLRNQHAAYNERIHELAPLFEPIPPPLQLADADSEMPLLDESIDCTVDIGNADEHDEIRGGSPHPVILNFDSDDDDSEHVEECPVRSSDTAMNENIAQDPQVKQDPPQDEAIVEPATCIAVDGEVCPEVQPPSTEDSVPSDENQVDGPAEEPSMIQHEREPERIYNDESAHDDDDRDSGMSGCSETERHANPAQAQPRTIVRYRIITDDNDERNEQVATNSHESYQRNDHDENGVSERDPDSGDAFVVSTPQRGPLETGGGSRSFNELHLSALLLTPRQDTSLQPAVAESTRAESTVGDQQEQLTPELARSCPLDEGPHDMTFNQTLAATFLANVSASETLTNESVPLASEAVVRFPQLTAGGEIQLVMTIRMEQDGAVIGKLNWSKPDTEKETTATAENEDL